ncbi:MAG TPA: hypothetical protein PKE47_10460, partial [Verrucomicrobiota bacterium]|nr:hypothetical protein [Verrucomicrobiota bacterium]
GALASICDYAEGKTIGEDRRTGALEILLTTPLEPEDLARGQRRALKFLLRPASLMAAALCLVWAARSWAEASLSGKETGSFLAAWTIAVLAMLGLTRSRLLSMWVALVTGRPGWGAIFTFRGLGVPLILCWLIFSHARFLVGFPSGSDRELFFWVGVAGFYLFATVLMVLWPRRFVDTNPNLLADMRAAAALPLPDLKDPDFRKWSGAGLPEFPSRPRPAGARGA